MHECTTLFYAFFFYPLKASGVAYQNSIDNGKNTVFALYFYPLKAFGLLIKILFKKPCHGNLDFLLK